ncbi:MAG: hypothetical protein AAF281_07470 [Pseudomonadota bacterium]
MDRFAAAAIGPRLIARARTIVVAGRAKQRTLGRAGTVPWGPPVRGATARDPRAVPFTESGA